MIQILGINQELTEIKDRLRRVEQNIPSLRDQFAMAALTGLLASAVTMGTREGYCQGAYEFADAMMKAREVK